MKLEGFRFFIPDVKEITAMIREFEYQVPPESTAQRTQRGFQEAHIVAWEKSTIWLRLAIVMHTDVTTDLGATLRTPRVFEYSEV